MSNPFRIQLSGLRKQKGGLDVDFSAPLKELKVSGSEIAEDQPIHVVGKVNPMDADDAVVFSGTASGRWQGQCRRCLEMASEEFGVEMREIFQPKPIEGETYELRGDSIDLELPVREAVMVVLPAAPLCRADCLGLCGECGANRNEADCDCEIDTRDPRWAALDALKEDSP